MNYKQFPLIILVATIGLSAASVSACDLCSIYSAVDSKQPLANTFSIGVAQQFSSFGKVQNEGHFIENEGNQHLESSISQIYGSYSLNDSLSFQVNLPYINRRYKRIENGEVDRGTEAGIGDMSILAKFIPYQYRNDKTIFYFQLLGGLKLPTGDDDKIAEELEHNHGVEDGAEMPTIDDENMVEEHMSASHPHSSVVSKHGDEHHPEEEMIASAIHGHDLVLGSGSYDFPIGFNIFAEQGRAFTSGSVQYVFRTEGSFDYEYADDLTWEVGPGYFIGLNDDYTVAIKANLSGEHKRKDSLNGERQGDTGINSKFLGPELLLTSGNWSAEVGWDIPLDINNTGLQSVVDYKLRAAIAYRF